MYCIFFTRSCIGRPLTSIFSLHFHVGETAVVQALTESCRNQQKAEIAGPSRVEELIFRQILSSRQENLNSMRRPENYDKRLETKRFIQLKHH